MLPGEFSVTLDAMVTSPCTHFEALLSIEWAEIGNPTRKSELFKFKALAQSSAVDWQNLEYETPYSTDVAEGIQGYVSFQLAAPEFGPRKLHANLGVAAGQDDPDTFAIIWNPTD